MCLTTRAAPFLSETYLFADHGNVSLIALEYIKNNAMEGKVSTIKPLS